jgi:superfamily II DNA/RNA helicase
VTLSQVPSGREPHEKRELLRHLLRGAKDLKNAIIFCNRKRDVAVLYKSLQKHGFSVVALHGDMDQPARMAALDQFRKGELPLLVASDVAARGLDIPEVSHVFNFDVPHHPDDYVHRIGRTGRAGRAGTAISIVTPLDQKSIVAIEKLIGQNIPRAEVEFTPTSDASGEGERPRGKRSRESSRRPRKSQHGEREPRHGEREPRHGNGSGSGNRHHGSHPHAKGGAAKSPSAPRHVKREAESESADHSHLPAFLLRPVRDRV